MVRFQRLTGCRLGKVCSLRPGDIDTSGDVWSYRPETHKNEHHERQRVIFIGPRAQDVLRPYLLRQSTVYSFSPANSERKRRRDQHEQRTTPLSCGNRDSETVWFGSRASDARSRIGERHASLCRTRSAKGGRNHAGSRITLMLLGTRQYTAIADPRRDFLTRFLRHGSPNSSNAASDGAARSNDRMDCW